VQHCLRRRLAYLRGNRHRGQVLLELVHISVCEGLLRVGGSSAVASPSTRSA
jgi:hypothetical protein